MNNMKQICEVMLIVLRKVEQKDDFLSQIRTPKLFNIEFSPLDLTADNLSKYYEYQLFMIIPESIN